MKKNILLVATGSVAVVKTKYLYEKLKEKYNVISIISPTVEENFNVDFPYEKEDKNLQSFPLHIKHAKWADLIVVAPATANTLSKFCYGIADNQVLTTLIAARTPILFAPAMNTFMLKNIKQRGVIEKLASYGHMFVGPNSGKLWEGEFGLGRMSEPQEIYLAIEGYFSENGKKVLIANGASKVYIDPIRFITNDSSGNLGRMLANEIKLLGHEVKIIDVSKYSSEELINIIENEEFDVYVSPAAINDFTLEKNNAKIKKANNLILKMKQDIDILSYVSSMGKEIIAFKHDELKDNAKKKMIKVNAKAIVWNKLGSMGGNKISGSLITKNHDEEFNDIPKLELAKKIAKVI